MLADFYGQVLIEPSWLPHTCADFQAAIERIGQAVRQHDLQDLVVAVEQTGEYHRPVQRAFRETGRDVRLVHPLASRHFRQPAAAGNKTDDTDLAGIHRATVNGFGLIEPIWPADYQQLQLLVRHRRDLVQKVTILCCQIREQLHAIMPGYAELFGDDLWHSALALPLARVSGSAAALRAAGRKGLAELVAGTGARCRQTTLTKILAWAERAPASHPHTAFLLRMLAGLDDDRLTKIGQIQALEQTTAAFLVGTPFVLLLAVPGINIVSAADLAGEMGPLSYYANANCITGRAGLVPSRYQSDRVDRPDGPLRRQANRRLRFALLQIADNLVTNNHHFNVQASRWRAAGKDPRWVRIKVAKTFSRIAFAMLAGPRLFPHPCCQPRHYILDKILAFHRDHDTPMSEVLNDLRAAADQLPHATKAAEAQPLNQRLVDLQASRRGPQELANIIPIVLARLGVTAV